jgi:uncharacterized protein (TIGR03118 family)
MVFNSAAGSSFLVGASPATFIFDTLNGTILGWNGGAGTTAALEHTTAGAIYTGLAQATNASGTFLFAANSAPGGRIDVFNSNWNLTGLSGSFFDPNLPAGVVPFNIQNIGGNLYVTYATLGPGGAPMPGGVVDEFDANGNLLKRIATGGSLFAPWGIVIAPSGFGAFSNDLLIGNFGNGEINAFDSTTDMFLGTLESMASIPTQSIFLPESTAKRTACSERSPKSPNPPPSSEPLSESQHSRCRRSDVRGTVRARVTTL